MAVLTLLFVTSQSIRPPLDNVCAMLRLLATLDSKPTRLNELNVASLGDLLSVYLIDMARVSSFSVRKLFFFYFFYSNSKVCACMWSSHRNFQSNC